MDNVSFRSKIEQLMAQVPAGQVTTYGDLAAFAGHPAAARIVGGIAHYGDITLPWYRLVNRFGGLARAYPGGPGVQQALLEHEGIAIKDLRVTDFEHLRWRPA